jgi:hypothetical protein
VLRRAIRFVNDNLTRSSWDEIALDVGLIRSRSAVASSCPLMTPHQYIIRCRLRRYGSLARDEFTPPISHFEVGCSRQSHLTTLFRKHLEPRPAPSVYRREASDARRRSPV